MITLTTTSTNLFSDSTAASPRHEASCFSGWHSKPYRWLRHLMRHTHHSTTCRGWWRQVNSPIADYLGIHGAAGLAGLNYVDAVTKSDPSFYGDGLKVQPLMSSEDLAINIAATRIFLRNSFEKQPSQDDFETMLAFNMMVPPKVRENMGGRTLSMDE